VIKAQGLGKTYMSGGLPLEVLKDVELTFESGSLSAVVGPSGSGKTTLLGLLAGLDAPSAGRVLLEDQDLTAMSEDEKARFRAENVGFVFQTFHLLASLTALENVLVPLELTGRAKKAADSARALLERVGLGGREGHYPAQLSGGERQRVALARAFANQPRILFADEPTGNLDHETGLGVAAMLEQMNRESGTTLVMVTHDLELAERAERVISLSGGRVVADRAGSGSNGASGFDGRRSDEGRS